MIKTNNGNVILSSFVVVTIIGFFVIGTIPVLIGYKINSLSEFYRFVILLFSLFLTSYLLIFKKNALKLSLLLFYIFWIMYILRILHDLYFSEIILTGDYTRMFYLQYALGVVFFPAFCIILITRNFELDFKYIFKCIFLILLFTLTFIVYKKITNFEIIDRSTQIISIGIIEFGHYGCTLILLSIYRIVEEKFSLLKLLLLVFAIIVGLTAIVISASKGPLIALLISLLIYLTFRFKVKVFVVVQALFGLLIYFFGFYFIELIEGVFDSNFLARVIYTIDEGKDEARSGLINAAIDDFLNSPIFGSAIFIQKSGFEGSYPHNLVVESFMATGVLGGLIFVLLVVVTLIKAIKLIISKIDISWVALIFFQYLFFGMVSSNLYSLDLFWITTGIISVVNSSSNVKDLTTSKIEFLG